MTDLHHYIKALLASHDCIIIPELGAFIAKYSPAVAGSQAPSTPSKILLFNRQLTRNDGLLINAIMNETNVDYKTAKNELDTFVNEAKTSLMKGESVNFEGIGSFMQDNAGFVHFTADPINETWLNSYGLNPVNLRKITTSNTSKKAQKTIKTPEVFKIIQSLKIKRIKISPKHLKLIYKIAPAVAALALIIFLATPPPAQLDTTDTEIEDTIATNTPQVEKESLTPEEAVAIEEIKETTPPPTSREIKTKIEKPKATPQIAKETYYHVIIASVASEKLAKQHIVRFEELYKFKDLEIIKTPGRYRISASKYGKKEEAEAFLRSFKLVVPTLNDAWIFAQTK